MSDHSIIGHLANSLKAQVDAKAGPARPGTEWAARLVAQWEAGEYRSKSILPLKMAREVMDAQNHRKALNSHPDDIWPA